MTKQLGALTVNSFPVPDDLPVLCPQCGKGRRPHEMMKFRGRRTCTECVNAIKNKEENQRSASDVEEFAKQLIFKQLDLRLASGPGERQPPDPAVVLDAFYEQFNGPHEFGRKWAEVVEVAADRAITEKVGAVQAARMMLDVHRATAASHDAFQDRDIERMSLEEAKIARQQLIEAEYARMMQERVGSRLMSVLKAIASDPDKTDLEGFMADLQRTMDEARQRTLEPPAPAVAHEEASDG
jgi:hypothetical protein